MKNYILVLLTVLGIGVLATPNVSYAEDNVEEDAVTSMVENQLELADLTEMETISQMDLETISEIANISRPTYTRTNANSAVSSMGAGASLGADYNVTATSSVMVQDPGNEIYRTGNLLYAHAYKAFSSLKSLGVGAIFSVSEGGEVTNYQVSEVRYFKKINANTVVLCGSGLEACEGQNQMAQIKSARYIDENLVRHAHKIALMTCAGNNDSHRLVVFAD